MIPELHSIVFACVLLLVHDSEATTHKELLCTVPMTCISYVITAVIVDLLLFRTKYGTSGWGNASPT